MSAHALIVQRYFLHDLAPSRLNVAIGHVLHAASDEEPSWLFNDPAEHTSHSDLRDLFEYYLRAHVALFVLNSDDD